MENTWDFDDDLIEIEGLYKPDNNINYCQYPKKEFIKEINLKIPKQKPNIEKLAKILIKADIIKNKIIDTPEGSKAIIQGKINKQIYYVADNPEQSVHAAHFEIPFCNFIKLPDCYKIKKIKVYVEDVSSVVVNPRKINECVVIFICVIPECCDC